MNCKPVKFNIVLTVYKVQLSVSFKCNLKVVLERGNKKYSLPHSVPLLQQSASATFNTEIKFPAIFFKDVNTNAWYDDICSISVFIIGDRNKVAGILKLKPTNMLNDDKLIGDFKIKLERCPDKTAYLHYGMEIKEQQELEAKTFYNEIELAPHLVTIGKEYYPEKIIEEKIESSKLQLGNIKPNQSISKVFFGQNRDTNTPSTQTKDNNQAFRKHITETKNNRNNNEFLDKLKKKSNGSDFQLQKKIHDNVSESNQPINIYRQKLEDAPPVINFNIISNSECDTSKDVSHEFNKKGKIQDEPQAIKIFQRNNSAIVTTNPLNSDGKDQDNQLLKSTYNERKNGIIKTSPINSKPLKNTDPLKEPSKSKMPPVPNRRKSIESAKTPLSKSKATSDTKVKHSSRSSSCSINDKKSKKSDSRQKSIKKIEKRMRNQVKGQLEKLSDHQISLESSMRSEDDEDLFNKREKSIKIANQKDDDGLSLKDHQENYLLGGQPSKDAHNLKSQPIPDSKNNKISLDKTRDIVVEDLFVSKSIMNIETKPTKKEVGTILEPDIKKQSPDKISNVKHQKENLLRQIFNKDIQNVKSQLIPDSNNQDSVNQTQDFVIEEIYVSDQLYIHTPKPTITDANKNIRNAESSLKKEVLENKSNDDLQKSAENKNLLKENSHLKNEIGLLQTQVTDAYNIVETYKEKNIVLKDELEVKNKVILQKVEEKLDNSQYEVQRKEYEIKGLKEKINLLTEEVKSLQDERDELMIKFELIENNSVEEHKSTHSLINPFSMEQQTPQECKTDQTFKQLDDNQEISRLNKSNEKLSLEKSNLENELNNYKQKNAKLEREYCQEKLTTDSRLEFLINENTNLKQEVSLKKQQIDETIADNSMQIAQLNKSLLEKIDVNKNFKIEIEELENKLTQQKEDFEKKLDENKKDQHNEIELLKGKIDVKEKEKLELIQEKEEQQKEINKKDLVDTNKSESDESDSNKGKANKKDKDGGMGGFLIKKQDPEPQERKSLTIPYLKLINNMTQEAIQEKKEDTSNNLKIDIESESQPSLSSSKPESSNGSPKLKERIKTTRNMPYKKEDINLRGSIFSSLKKIKLETQSPTNHKFANFLNKNIIADQHRKSKVSVVMPPSQVDCGRTPRQKREHIISAREKIYRCNTMITPRSNQLSLRDLNAITYVPGNDSPSDSESFGKSLTVNSPTMKSPTMKSSTMKSPRMRLPKIKEDVKKEKKAKKHKKKSEKPKEHKKKADKPKEEVKREDELEEQSNASPVSINRTTKGTFSLISAPLILRAEANTDRDLRKEVPKDLQLDDITGNKKENQETDIISPTLVAPQKNNDDEIGEDKPIEKIASFEELEKQILESKISIMNLENKVESLDSSLKKSKKKSSKLKKEKEKLQKEYEKLSATFEQMKNKQDKEKSANANLKKENSEKLKISQMRANDLENKYIFIKNNIADCINLMSDSKYKLKTHVVDAFISILLRAQ